MSPSSMTRALVRGSAADDEVCKIVFKLNTKLQARAQWVKEQEQRHVQEKSEFRKQFTN